MLAFRAMEADARVAVDVAALNAVVDALARCGRMGDAEKQLDRAMQLCERQGAPLRRAPAPVPPGLKSLCSGACICSEILIVQHAFDLYLSCNLKGSCSLLEVLRNPPG